RVVVVPAQLDLVSRRETGAGGFYVRGHASATQLSTFLRFCFSFGKLIPSVAFKGGVHHARKITTVVLEAGGDLVRKLVLGNEVAPAELGRVHAELARGVVHQALERVGHDRAAGAAV